MLAPHKDGCSLSFLGMSQQSPRAHMQEVSSGSLFRLGVFVVLLEDRSPSGMHVQAKVTPSCNHSIIGDCTSTKFHPYERPASADVSDRLSLANQSSRIQCWRWECVLGELEFRTGQ